MRGSRFDDAVHARDDRLRAKDACVAPIAAIHDDRVDLVDSFGGLAQRSGRQAEAIAHAAHAVDHRDLEAPPEPVMLQAIVGDHDVHSVLGKQTLRGGDPVGPRDDRAAGAAREQHGLVADLVAGRSSRRRRAANLARCRDNPRVTMPTRKLRAWSCAASQITNGVLPVPPTLTLPTTTTGTGSSTDFNRLRR